MTAPRGKRRGSSASRETRQEGDIGYRRPPAKHQFQPGQSGNPKGRPKGRKNEATILASLLQRKIILRENGQPRRITILEAILLRFTEDSLKGNTKSAQFILNRYHTVCGGEERAADEDELTKNDKDIIRAFAQRIKRRN
jgi:hypothetical protein